MSESWKSEVMRNRVIQQIDGALRQSSTPSNKSAQELELQIFNRSKKSDDYVAFVNKIMTHFSDKQGAASQQNMQGANQVNTLSSSQSNPHLAAMLTGQSTTGVQMQQNTQMGQQSNQMGNQMAQNPQMVGHGNQGMGIMNQNINMSGMNAGQGMVMGGQSNQMSPINQQGGQMTMNRMNSGNQVIGQMGMGGQASSNIGLGGGQVLNNTGGAMMRPQGMGMGMVSQPGDMNWQGGNSPMSMGVMKPGMGQIPMNKMGQMQMAMARGVNVSGSPSVMQTRVPSPAYVPPSVPRQTLPTSASPMGGGMSMMSSQSPAFIPPSPQSNPIQSPAGRGMVGVPSPSQGMLNTPGSQTMQPSPVAPTNQTEDKAYFEKVKKLQKYIEPLKTLLVNCGNEEDRSNDANKMQRLLKILQNPQWRTPMETLEKCEKVLEKMISQKESAVEVFMEGVRAALNSPNPGHVFHKTFSPALEKLNGSSIPMPPMKKRKLSDSKQEQPNGATSGIKINYTIQGEVARLSPRFKVNLDSQQPNSSDDFTLTCHIDDANLPCVPPLTLNVPHNYPELSPTATLSALEYSATDFLKKVRDAFMRRQKHVPFFSSITMLLDSWEMSIRSACSPSSNPDAVSPITAVMELCDFK